MTALLLTGGRLVDPAAGLDTVGDLLLDAGRVRAVGDIGTAPEGARRIDCAGRLVVPGLVDLHIHLREPPEGDPPADLAETVATGAAAAAAGGFTAVCAMPNTTPPLDTPDRVSAYIARGQAAGAARVYPVAAMTRGRAGAEPADLAAMKEAGAVACSDDGDDVADPAVFDAVCRAAARAGLVVICHCEDAALAGEGVMHAGPVAETLGVPGIPPEAESAAVRRACQAAARLGCRVHVAHVSTAASVEAIRRAKAAGAPVTAEATPHHLALTDAALAGGDALFKVNPPLRGEADVAAVVEAIVDGTIDAIATDHAPHPMAAKALPLADAPAGLVGLETAVAVAARVLVACGRLTWPELIDRMAARPAAVLGLPGGTLAIGSPADVTVLDPEARWRIEPARFVSRARNCPFTGWDVAGRAVLTVVAGRVVFDRDAAS